MEEDELFDEFYTTLKDIVNLAFNLGDPILEPNIVRNQRNHCYRGIKGH